MTIRFADSERSTVGLEWELMLADPQTGDLVGRAPELLAALETASAAERHTVTGELLTNTIEVTSGVGRSVSEAAADIAAAIWGIHVHVGVEDREKVFPIIGALTAHLPHLQALSASSPFWAGERTGYASNRALVFQQLPTAGLPWPLRTWGEFESYLGDMQRTGVLTDASEVRWDIRPAPRWGTIEVRACDGMSSLPELTAVAALVQTLVEHFSRRIDEGEELPCLPPWFHRENKWRTARYGLEAEVIVDASGTQRPVGEHLGETLAQLAPIAADLGAAADLTLVQGILDGGASYARQLKVAEETGDLRAVVRHLITEFEDGLR